MTAYNVYRARKAEREHPPAGKFVTVDGIRLHYIERGEGPPVVLLHGNLVTAKDFDTSRVLDLVAKRHVIAFDRPGFGYSDRPHGSAWSAATQADLIRDAFAVLGINRPIVLGHSPGVGHMVHYAVPDEVARTIEEAGKSAMMFRPTGRASASYTASAA
jgi:alpha-beta hydrolase superfamily lysophospholipase